MSDDNVQWITVNGKHIPLGGDTGVSMPDGELGDKAKGYIQSENYSKLGTLFSEHRKEFGLKKKDDAYIKAYQVIKGAHKESDEDKKDKEISEHQKESEKLTFEKKLDQLNGSNTMVAKVGKNTYVVEKNQSRVVADKKPNGQPLYATKTTYSVTKFTKGASSASTHIYKANEFNKFLEGSGATSRDWTIRGTRLSSEEKDKLF